MENITPMFCIRCGQALAENAKFCRACGAPVPNVAPAAAQAPAQDAPVQAAEPAESAPAKPEKKKSKKAAVFSLIAGVIALTALIVLIIICPQTYDRNGEFEGVCAGSAVFAAAGLICFFIGKKNKAAVIGGVVSAVVIVGICGFTLLYIPKAKENFEDAYLDTLKRVGSYETGVSFHENAYPYDSAHMFFFHERTSYEKVESQLIKYYDDGEISRWIGSSMFVNQTLNLSLYNKSFLERLCENGYEIDAYELRGYSVLFSNSKFASSFLHCNGENRVRSEIESRVRYVDNNNTGIYQGNGGSFYLFNGAVIYKDYCGYIVIDLNNGNYFYSGEWL